jgi:hypothetical protein
VGLVFVLVVALTAQGPGCATCHAPEQAAEVGSFHAPSASCVDCHGGDAKQTDKLLAHGPGYAGKIARSAVPALCSRCHSDARKMNAYGLPTDQFAQYQTSRHGESLAKGNLQVAICTDCHGVHGILRSRDPRSPTYPANVPATCGRCHSDRGKMEKLGHPWDEEALYRDSVHGELLLKKGDLSAPQCATCHGNHGAAPPGFGAVVHVCGKCHPSQAQFFEASPHAFYAKDGSFKGCIACHGNHRIVTSATEIVGRCAPCHEKPDAEMTKFAALRDVLAGIRGDFGKTGDRLARASRAGLFTDDEQLALDQARTSLLQLAPLQHTLSAPKVGELAKQTASQLAAIERNLDRMERTERTKKMALIPLWIFLGAMAWVFRARGKQFESPK